MSCLLPLSSLSCLSSSRLFSPLRLVPAAAALAALLSGCGGGGGDSTAAADAPAPTVVAAAAAASNSFPTGLVVASPADLSQEAASRVSPQSASSAAALAGMADFTALFQVGGHAGCQGPAMLYANHEDGSIAASGQMPAGDAALWQATDAATGQPCMVAELRERTAGVKLQTRQGLLMMAALRAALATSPTAPAAGGSVDLSRAFAAMAGAVPALAGVNVGAASVALDAQGRTYTYRLTLSQGSASEARSGEIVMTHTPGADANAYSGVLRVAGFELTGSTDEGCNDLMHGSRYKVARVTTVRYQRAGDQIDFGARSGRYCGAPASLTDADHAGQVATFTADGQLDPAARLASVLPGSPVVAAGARGWRGDFDRFAGHYDPATGAGQFLHAWQAGTADTHARVMATRAAYNSATDERTLQGYFAFGQDIAATDGQMLGMICNWSGPGNTHIPVPLFQSQTATLASQASVFTATSSKLSHAPTRNCSSISTLFDANADGVLTPGEGLGARQGLDEPAVGRSVQAEIVSRGFAQPALF